MQNTMLDSTVSSNSQALFDFNAVHNVEIGLPKIFGRRINTEDSCGVPHPTTIYNLTVSRLSNNSHQLVGNSG